MCNCERKRFRDSVNRTKVKCFFWLQLLMIWYLMFQCFMFNDSEVKFCKNTPHYKRHTELIFKCKELVSHKTDEGGPLWINITQFLRCLPIKCVNSANQMGD